MSYLKPVSPSSLRLWNECPTKWADAYINGNWGPAGPAALRGTALHEKLEAFFKGETPYPSGDTTLRPWQQVMEELAAGNPIAEGECAVDLTWAPVDFKSPDAYYRGKKDLEIPTGDTLTIFDWKSGRISDDHEFQGASYAALSPGYEKYIVKFVYLDHPLHIKTWEYSAEEVGANRSALSRTINELRDASEYPATPGDGCRWCPLSWRRGGSCKRAR